MDNLGLKADDRVTVPAAVDARKRALDKGKGKDGIVCGAAIQLTDGTIITGSNSEILHASSALILNATKHLAGIPKSIHLLPENIMDSVRYLKDKVLDGRRISLDLDEVMISLAISAANNPAAKEAVDCLKKLSGCEVHLTHLPSAGDEAGLRRLGINLTSAPLFASKRLLED
jgi:uncharacterized protein (UPF0371 family)